MYGSRNLVHGAHNTRRKRCGMKKTSANSLHSSGKYDHLQIMNEVFHINKQKNNLGFSQSKIQRNVVGTRTVSRMLGSLYGLVGRQKTRHNLQDVV